jgi:CRISPR-associated protein Cmr2
MNKYYGLSIGPITKTINSARKTLPLWFSSYIFSYIMENIYINLKGKEDIEILLPYVDEQKIEKIENIEYKKYSRIGAGIYPDKLFIEVKNNKDNVFFGVIDNTKIKLKKIFKEMISEEMPDNKIIAFVDNYFMFYIVELTQEKTSEEKNVKEKLSNLLDHFENNINISKKIEYLNEESIIENIFEKNKKIKEHDIFKNSGLKDINLFDKNDDENKDLNLSVENIMEKNYKSDNSKYEKYIAYVYADGDSLGKKILNEDKNRNVSKSIFNFSLEAAKLINEYNGLSVYTGGDDLSFIVPLKTENNNNEIKTIFELLKDLTNSYNKNFKSVNDKYNDKDKKTTLSFGVNIVSHKYPLNEARKQSYDLLSGAKKEFKGKNRTKVNVKKSSGVNYSINYNNDLYKKIIEEDKEKYNILDSIINKEDKNILNSLSNLSHKMLKDKYIILEMLKAEEDENKNKAFKDYFDSTILNQLNSSRNSIEKNNSFIENILSYIETFKDSLKDNNKDKDKDIILFDEVINYISIIKFFYEKGEND